MLAFKLGQIEINVNKMEADKAQLNELINEENERQTKLESIEKSKHQIDLDNIDAYINDDFKEIKGSLEGQKLDFI